QPFTIFPGTTAIPINVRQFQINGPGYSASCGVGTAGCNPRHYAGYRTYVELDFPKSVSLWLESPGKACHLDDVHRLMLIQDGSQRGADRQVLANMLRVVANAIEGKPINEGVQRAGVVEGRGDDNYITEGPDWRRTPEKPPEICGCGEEFLPDTHFYNLNILNLEEAEERRRSLLEGR
ncbi:MAG: hypothetical protein K2Z81_15320, partial [Cyanobacteria bacterium]|nr:hypothetical protein [Cyanobacteriota bacterium]